MKFTDIPLGARVRDKISGFQGIVECRSEWLNGCLRISVAPDSLDKDGNLREPRTFDIEQIETIEQVHEPKPPARRTNGPMPSPVRR